MTHPLGAIMAVHHNALLQEAAWVNGIFSRTSRGLRDGWMDDDSFCFEMG